ncbi:stationary phase survival protein SurE [Legionella shakespearei DSM 23087]|uniref:5'-nucleotidase SurE n=2 Tax=Legionella shakespearei TaxID=45075 RepID=A0A0W0YQT5_9GAMM|nr:stationary phase survival protein SurE [Legionella shakespearei DSM 23087]
MMRILVSNDDGVTAPGIKVLATELATIAEVNVVAPDRNRSGASNSLTLRDPLRVKQLDNGYYSVEGTPTDCVHLALTGFLEPVIDIVVSGINEGANLGDDVLYSGTVAAAMEGRYLGLPAIAVSMVGEHNLNYQTAAVIAKQLVVKLSRNKLPSQTILNINVPNLPLEKIKGLQVTRLGTRHGAEPMVKEYDPRGRPIYWVGPPGLEADAGPGTDFHAVNSGYVSITPLHLDMTHYKIFDQLSTWLNGFNVLD